MNRIAKGLLFGAAAGVVDVTPMLIQKLPLQADMSAFLTWVVIGFLISAADLKLKPVLKGLLVSFSVVIPVLVLISWDDKTVLVPVIVMTFILGSILGYFLRPTEGIV